MMRKLLVLCLCLMMAVPLTAAGEGPAREDLPVSDYLLSQATIDEMLIAEAENGYPFEEPMVILNPYGNAPLSAVVLFSTEEATAGTVTVKGKAPEDDITGSFEAGTVHYVPIYGLYPGEATRVELELEDGRTSSFEVTADTLSLGLAGYTAEMYKPELYDYGTLTICGNMALRCYAGYDSKGDLRWALTDTGTNAITRLPNGHFLIPNVYGHGAEFPNGMTGIREIDPLGKVYHSYVWNGGEHHEIIVMPSGTYMVTGSKPGYATNRDYVFEIDPVSGEVVWELDMGAVITPGSSGCSADQGQDWCHNNALAYDEASDTLLISCRHICAVIAVEKSTKQLKWIFGDPAGWAEEYTPYLLTADSPDFPWSYGQHQLTILSNGDLLLFDNGEFGRVKMVNQDQAIPDEQNYSRAVIYRINEADKTVSQIWEYGRELGSACYCNAMSGIQCLDEAAGRYLITFGTCVDEADEDGSATHIYLIQNDEPVWNLNYTGENTYRGYRYPLYGGDAYAPGIKGCWHGDMGVTAQIGDPGTDADNAVSGPEGAEITLFPFNAIRFSGSFLVTDDALLTKYAAVLRGEDGNQTAYDLGYIKGKTEKGTKVTFSRWISLNDMAPGKYGIYIVMNGVTYDTGKTVSVGQ